jgi:hypothetical protein
MAPKNGKCKLLEIVEQIIFVKGINWYVGWIWPNFDGVEDDTLRFEKTSTSHKIYFAFLKTWYWLQTFEILAQ